MINRLAGVSREIIRKRSADKIQEMNYRDPLTGLYNRRFFKNNIDTLLDTMQHRCSGLAILLCDMDYFMPLNHEHGHRVGDRVLTDIAAVFRENIRAGDLAIRFGGDEFLVLLVDGESASFMQVAETIRTRVEDRRFRHNGVTLQTTISIGVSEYPADNKLFLESFRYADFALSMAKKQGRNRVVRFSGEMSI